MFLLFRGLISLIAVFLSIAFLGQIFSVWTAIELRNIIQLDYLQPGPVKEVRRTICRLTIFDPPGLSRVWSNTVKMML